MLARTCFVLPYFSKMEIRILVLDKLNLRCLVDIKGSYHVVVGHRKEANQNVLSKQVLEKQSKPNVRIQALNYRHSHFPPKYIQIVLRFSHQILGN